MNLQSRDVHDYTIAQLMQLFTLSPGFTEEQLQLAKQKLTIEIPKLRNSGMGRSHEVALFIDCACNRLRDETAVHPEGTWAQRTNPLVKGAGTHAVQSNPNALAGRNASIVSGRRAESGEAPPGWLNPINVRTVDFAMNIDSRFRDNYYMTSSTDWKMDLPVTQRKVASMRVASLQLPLSAYAINHMQGNATMLVIDGHTASGLTLTAWSIRLPDGNYEAHWDSTEAGEQHLTPAMTNALVNATVGQYDCDSGVFRPTPGAPAEDITGRIEFGIDHASGKAHFNALVQTPPGLGPLLTLAFAVDNDGSRDLRQNLQLKLGWQLGFRVGFYRLGVSGQLAEATAVSEAICSPCGPRYAYLAIDDGNNNHGSTMVASFASSSFSKDIMLRINLAAEVAANGVFRYMAKAGIASSWWRSREYFGPVTISKLGFKLFDEYGRIMDLNGMDWSMALVFESIYD